MKYQGSCHCGHVTFEATGDIASVLSCNCSICQRKGALLWFVPKRDFTLLTPDANASTYAFNQHAISHRFCPVCGIQPYSEAKSPTGEWVAAVNVRCIEGIELDAIPVTPYDGRSR